jgi:hypothetical protein
VVTWGYHVAVRQLERSGAVILPAELCFSDDLARARSRCVRVALERDDWDWLLFWDDDVVPADTSIVPRMIARADADRHDWIGAPYPRKRIPAQFPYKPLASSIDNGRIIVVNDCIEVELLAIGFTLIRRRSLAMMVMNYSDEWFTDSHERGEVKETIGIFRQIMTPITHVNGRRFRELYSEDYSACYRWRQMGGKVQMFVGDGAPLAHVGGHVFLGAREDIR